jgi:Nif-specific regulatory protein
VSASNNLDTLFQVSQAMVHHHDVSALLNEVLDILERGLGVQRSTLTLLRSGTDELVIEASKGLTQQEMRRGQYKVGEGVTGRVAASLQAEIVPDVSAEPTFLDKTGSRGDSNVAFLCVPVIRQNELMGTVSIDLPSAPLGDLEEQLAFLKIIANVIAEAVYNIRSQVEERESLLEENRRLRLELGEQYRPDNIIGNCRTMRTVYKQIAQVAGSPATVLIRGESGTGKELVARALHYASDRKNGPFITVNCAALPENLIESELFGHEKGAFTGAIQQRAGRFELANGGTLFLDEIGDISLAVQVRLLRVLQERVFERVGGAESINVNVRIITATSRDLEKGIEDNTFREDLYYRLNVFPIHLPPLRDRRSDIVLLADHFLAHYGRMYNQEIVRMSTTAINMMMSYHWPGNVRELENCTERAVLTSSDGVIHGYNLPPSLQTAKATHTELVPSDIEGASLETMVASYEREIIVDALKGNRGNCAATARFLNTTQRILNYRIKKLGVNAKQYRYRENG